MFVDGLNVFIDLTYFAKVVQTMLKQFFHNPIKLFIASGIGQDLFQPTDVLYGNAINLIDLALGMEKEGQ